MSIRIASAPSPVSSEARAMLAWWMSTSTALASGNAPLGFRADQVGDLRWHARMAAAARRWPCAQQKRQPRAEHKRAGNICHQPAATRRAAMPALRV